MAQRGQGFVAERRSELAAHYHRCERLLHARDRDCWLACLFAPFEARAHLHALYAFKHEIAAAPAKVSQPLLGEMRLRWWADALEGSPETATSGGARAHPVADAVIDTIGRYSLPRAEFLDLIQAHLFDLHDRPMATLEELDAYCRSTSSAPMRWSAQVIGGAAQDTVDAIENAGVALALTRLLRALAEPAAFGQVFTPTALLARHGSGQSEIRNRAATPALRAALAELRTHARSHYDRARRALKSADPAQAALLPAALVPLYLARMERKEYDPFAACVDLPQWRRQWRLWRASRRNGL
ncbi:MAG: squalene/phytoene synthase family protein [Methylocystis sp.]|nr:squalene/phytoene synthase family protein [Methylocystis sp.]